jgi:hypothetical protein
MDCAAEYLGAGRGSGMEPAGRDAESDGGDTASSSEPPSEAHAATAKLPISATTPGMRKDIAFTPLLRGERIESSSSSGRPAVT